MNTFGGCESTTLEQERKKTMKCMKTIALAGALMGLAGCASVSKVTVTQPIGPPLTGRAEATGDGSLQVFSERVRADVDINAEEFAWNNDFGRNDFLYESAHTDYFIYTPDGQLYQRVRNSRGRNDNNPTLVTLPAGSYRIEAEAARNDGESLTLDVPVIIEPGQTTTVHLERDWKPSKTMADNHALVQAYDGRIIGWRANRSTEPTVTQMRQP
jgi:hypothetical protein